MVPGTQRLTLPTPPDVGKTFDRGNLGLDPGSGAAGGGSPAARENAMRQTERSSLDSRAEMGMVAPRSRARGTSRPGEPRWTMVLVCGRERGARSVTFRFRERRRTRSVAFTVAATFPGRGVRRAASLRRAARRPWAASAGGLLRDGGPGCCCCCCRWRERLDAGTVCFTKVSQTGNLCLCPGV